MNLVTVLLLYEIGLQAVQFGNNWTEVCSLAVRGILNPNLDKHDVLIILRDILELELQTFLTENILSLGYVSGLYSSTQVLPTFYAAWKINSGK